MSDYQSRADMMRTWTVAEVKAQPHLAVGQLHSAAAIIEKLTGEVERLNRENFWLSKQEPATKNSTTQLPKVKLKDRQIEAIVGMAKHNMNIAEVARAYSFSRGNICYHCDVVKEKTGLDPRCFSDLVKLLEMVEGNDG